MQIQVFEEKSREFYSCKISGHFLQVYHAFNSLCALVARWAYECNDIVGLQGLGYIIAEEMEEEEVGKECIANPLLWFVNHHWMEEQVERRGVFCLADGVKSGVVLLADGTATIDKVKGILRKERDDARLRQLREDLEQKEANITLTTWRKSSLNKSSVNPSPEPAEELKVQPEQTLPQAAT